MTFLDGVKATGKSLATAVALISTVSGAAAGEVSVKKDNTGIWSIVRAHCGLPATDSANTAKVVSTIRASGHANDATFNAGDTVTLACDPADGNTQQADRAATAKADLPSYPTNYGPAEKAEEFRRYGKECVRHTQWMNPTKSRLNPVTPGVVDSYLREIGADRKQVYTRTPFSVHVPQGMAVTYNDSGFNGYEHFANSGFGVRSAADSDPGNGQYSDKVWNKAGNGEKITQNVNLPGGEDHVVTIQLGDLTGADLTAGHTMTVTMNIPEFTGGAFGLETRDAVSETFEFPVDSSTVQNGIMTLEFGDAQDMEKYGSSWASFTISSDVASYTLHNAGLEHVACEGVVHEINDPDSGAADTRSDPSGKSQGNLGNTGNNGGITDLGGSKTFNTLSPDYKNAVEAMGKIAANDTGVPAVAFQARNGQMWTTAPAPKVA